MIKRLTLAFAIALLSGLVQAQAPAAVSPASAAALPDNDPDAHFKGQMGGTFGRNVAEALPDGKRVAIVGFRVAYVVSNTATAKVRASSFLGRDTSGASSKMNVALGGVDAATFQALTDKAYADFIAQMKAAGREVVPADQLKEFFSGLEVTPSTADKLYTKEAPSQTAVILSPTGMPLWFTNWDAPWGDKGAFDQANYKRVGEYSNKLNAIVVAPLIVVNFARMSSSGNRSGLFARNAETGAELSMHIGGFSSPYIRAEEFRGGVSKGDEGSIRMVAEFVSNSQFGTLKQVSAEDNSGVKSIFDTLGKSMGMLNAGGASRSVSTNIADTTNAAYSAAASDALGIATGTFAKWFQKYPAR